MKRKTYKIEIYVDVFDTAALRRAAEERYVTENWRPRPGPPPPVERKRLLAGWRSMRKDSGDPVSCDLQELFDPGISPSGTEIQESHAEGAL